MNLRIYDFNNYYNRIVKRLDVSDEKYSNYLYQIEKANFNPADNIMTEHTFGNSLVPYYGNGNYLIVTDEFNEIVSRWFIIEQTRQRGGQWKLLLRRDLLVDFYQEIINSSCFIEKAILGTNDPLIFNSENMSFNQIKSGEYMLRDQTLSSWIVGYIDRDTEGTEITATDFDSYIAEYDSLEEIPFYSRISNNSLSILNEASSTFSVGYFNGIRSSVFTECYDVTFNRYGLVSSYASDDVDKYKGIQCTDEYKGTNAWKTPSLIAERGSAYIRSNSSELNAGIKASDNSLLYSNEIDRFMSIYTETGTVVKVGNDFYRITRSSPTTKNFENKTLQANVPTYSLMYTALLGMVYNAFSGIIKPTTATSSYYNNFKYSYSTTTYSVSVKKISVDSVYKTSIPSKTNRRHLNDAPYDMFAIPYNFDASIGIYASTFATEVDPKAALLISNAIAKLLGGVSGSSKIYDLQLLPFSPFPELYLQYGNIGEIDLIEKDLVEGKDFNYIKFGDQIVSIMLWSTKSTFSTIIKEHYKITSPTNVTKTKFSTITEITNPKIQSETEMYRLVSPNYNGQFEFNAVKNNGINFFQVDCTYKPFSPYIRIAPNFNYLYGAEYGDARGLICGGNFSLPTITDQWINYEINNKNYLNAFDRQISSLELQNKYQRISDIASAISGTATGAVSGGFTGSMIGATPGAITGSIIGGVASGGAGAFDVYAKEKLRSDALDLTKDQFGYTLGNIQAMPTLLNRVSSFNANNKIFPILEFYTCTETEKDALIQKIKYNGMTVMKIGVLKDYILNKFEDAEYSYIKGKIIRLNNLNDDFHLSNEIANEIYKGVYI